MTGTDNDTSSASTQATAAGEGRSTPVLRPSRKAQAEADAVHAAAADATQAVADAKSAETAKAIKDAEDIAFAAPTTGGMSTYSSDGAKPEAAAPAAAPAAAVTAVDKGVGTHTAAVKAAKPSGPVTMADGSELGAVAGTEDFEALMEEAMSQSSGTELKPGDTVEGIIEVITLHGSEIFLDLGGRSTGYILKEELVDHEGNLTVKQGDTVQGVVVGSDANGIKIQRSLGRLSGDIGALQDALVTGLPVEGKVLSTNKGGFEVSVAGARGFCPMSQMEVYRTENPEEFVGQTLTFKVIEIKGNEAVLSRAALLKAEREEKAKEVRAKLQVGARLSGTVRSIQKFGAFVDLGGLDGLIHVSELSWEFGIDPHTIVKLGQEVEVVVLEIDNARDRIALSLKQAGGDPFDTAIQGLGIGTIAEGPVARLTAFGAFITLGPGVDGLVHVSDMAHHRVQHPKELLSVGDIVKVRVTDIDMSRRRIGLSLKALADDPWDTVTSRFPLESEVKGKVQSVRDFGVFVELEGGITALLPGSESGVPHGQPLATKYRVGAEIQARVLRVDADDRKMALTTREPGDMRSEPSRGGGGGQRGGQGGGQRRDGGGQRGGQRGGQGPRREATPRTWMDRDDESTESVGGFGALLLKAMDGNKNKNKNKK